MGKHRFKVDDKIMFIDDYGNKKYCLIEALLPMNHMYIVHHINSINSTSFYRVDIDGKFFMPWDIDVNDILKSVL